MPKIIRKFKDNYVQILNELAQNPNLSFGARGMITYMLSLPNDWDFTIQGIAKQNNVTERQVIKLLHELEANGYHKKEHVYENGRIKDWVYYIYDEPQQDIIDNYNNKKVKKQDVENKQCSKSYDKQTYNNKLLYYKQDNKEKNINNNYIYSEDTENINVENIKNNDDILVNNEKNINNIGTLHNNENVNKSKKDNKYNEEVKLIVQYLNETLGTNYKANNETTQKVIKARFKEGYELDDFYDVIDKKYKDWKNTELEKYLRPSTLFGNKFESYLNQKNYFKGNIKSNYSSKPSFDNTADHIVPKAVVCMTKEEKEDYIQNHLARDENGNLIKF